MKKLYFLFLLSILPLAANADAVEIKGIYYNLNASGGTRTAEVTKNPDKYSGSVRIPATVKYQGTEYKVTSVGEDAFLSCSDLTSVTVPNGVTSIGPGAFMKAQNLTSVTLPTSVSTIGEYAFADCKSLEEITLPEGLTAIEGGTFLYCGKLKKVAIPSTVTRIGARLDDDQSDGPFNACPIETLIVPASVQTIGQYGLWTSQYTVIVMESATPPAEMHEYALKDVFEHRCFKSIVVPDGSKAAYQAASYWKDFKDLIFEQGESPVRVLKGVSAGTLPTLIPEADKYLVTGLIITGSLNEADLRLLRDMAGNDYQGNPTEGQLKVLDLSGVTIADGGQLLFTGCDKLEELILPQNITSIGNNAFSGCSRLAAIEIPGGVTSIGQSAFSGCSSLATVVSKNPTPPACGANAFTNFTAPLYVPAGSIGLYKAADVWSGFGDVRGMADGDDAVFLSVNDGAHGSLKLRIDSEKPYVTLKFEAESGWHVYSLSLDGEDVTAEMAADGTYTTPALNDDAILHVVYAQGASSAPSLAANTLRLTAFAGNLTVSGTSGGERITVFTLDGKHQASATARTGRTEIPLQEDRVYVVKVDDHVYKIRM